MSPFRRFSFSPSSYLFLSLNRRYFWRIPEAHGTHYWRQEKKVPFCRLVVSGREQRFLQSGHLASDQSRGHRHSHTSHRPTDLLAYKTPHPVTFSSNTALSHFARERNKELKRDGEAHAGAGFGSHGGPGDGGPGRLLRC